MEIGVMQPRVNPLPYGAKVRKIFNKQFYLSERDFSELLIKLETNSLSRMRDVVAFIDERGSFLD